MKFLYIFLTTTLLVSCENTRKQPQPTSPQIKSVYRQSDNLLNRKDLQEIVALQSDRNAQSLSAFFTHEDPAIRARAAFAMGSVQDSAALPGLLLLLNDPVKEVRLDAAFAVRQNYGTPTSELLLYQLKKEKDPEVQSMLLEAIGFQGDEKVYEQVFKLSLNHIASAQALCAIYYLQQRKIISQTGVDKMLELLQHADPFVRERAAYFFYTMVRKKVVFANVASSLRNLIKSAEYNEVSVPYLLSYLSSDPMPSDAELFIDWSIHGSSLRAKSYAVIYMLPYARNEKVRLALIDGLLSTDYQVFMAAAQAIADCEHLSSKDLDRIKQLINGGTISFNALPYLLKSLNKYGEKLHVLSIIEHIPIEQEIALIAAIGGVKELEFEDISKHLYKLSRSQNQQVVLMTGEYMASRFSRSKEDQLLPILDDLLRSPSFPRLKSDFLLAMAHNMKKYYANSFRIQLFQGYYNHFVNAGDQISASICLIVLGDIQDESIKPLLENAANNENEIIKMAGEGALSLLDADPKTLVDVYRNEMRFTPTTKIDWEFLKALGRFPKFIIETSKGNMVIQADVEQAPMGIQNLVEHARAGIMDSTYIHRVETNHVIQFGTLGHSKKKVLSEFTRIPKVEYSVGIGDLGKDTGSQHFAICHLMRPHNEGLYTTIGTLISGHDVMMNINKYDLILNVKVISSE
jgi:cyclophilin family peptidyl-prolyl cis-trans isomerase/HEAT repeat protein